MGTLLATLILLALDYLAVSGIIWVIMWALTSLGVALTFAWSWGLCFFIWVIIKCLKLLFG